MKFGPVPVGQAAGCVLAHSVPLPKGRLRKGVVLSASDVAQLAHMGLAEVIVARLDVDDLGEDVAADMLADALLGEARRLRRSKAATGRVNIHSERAGIVALDPSALNAFNAINPMITIATLPQYMRVDPGTMVATVKVISYAVPQTDVASAADAARGAISHLAPRFTTATLIETVIGADPPLKGRAAIATRLDRLGVRLTDRVVVPHRTSDVAAAIAAALGEVIFILTASATSDIADVAPAAAVAAGGKIVQFGMPVDPGNLLFLGSLDEKPIIGLPGCARSPALNGADWVMERVICGVDLTPADFAMMGVGGLLKEIPTRPQPRRDIEPS